VLQGITGALLLYRSHTISRELRYATVMLHKSRALLHKMFLVRVALLLWWALSDLNGRPFGCKPNALTAELSALL
jgi:hypothetical protein